MEEDIDITAKNLLVGNTCRMCGYSSNIFSEDGKLSLQGDLRCSNTGDLVFSNSSCSLWQKYFSPHFQLP